MAPLFTANLSTLTSSLVENAALTNVFTINLTDGDPVPTPRTITVPYTVAGTALNGTDYQTLTGSVDITIAANATSGSATVQIDPIDDLQLEGTETLTLSLAADPSATPQYVLGTTQTSSTIAIVDDFSASETSLLPQISVVAGDPVAEEVASTLGGATASFTFTRSNASAANPLTVYFTVGGTATPDPDPSPIPDDSGDYVQTTVGNAFVAPPNSGLPSIRFITFAANETTATVSFNAIDDAEFDPNESVTITILPSNLVNANPADQYTIGNFSATATIADNEVIPTVSISPASSTVDEGGFQTFTLTLDNGPAARDLYIQLNVAGTATNSNLLGDVNGAIGAGADTGDDFFVPDFLLATTPTVLIEAGQTSVTFTVRTQSDSNPVNDDNETVLVTVLGGEDYTAGTTGSAALSIRDLDNQGQVSIIPGTSLAVEGGVTATFTIQRTGYNLGQVVIPFTLNGTATSLTDYTITVTGVSNGTATVDLANGTITLGAVSTAPADGTTQTVTVELTALADGVVDSVIGDGTENITLTLTDSPTGLYTLGTSNSTGEIRIDDVDILQLPSVTIASTIASVAEEEAATDARMPR